MIYKKLNNAFFEEINGQLRAVSDPETLRKLKTGQLRAEEAPAIAGGAERFATPERSLTPLGGNRSLDDTTAPERNLQTQGSPLTDFAETLSKATDLARKKRNRMSMELLGERFDMSAEPASGFAGILADINRASQKYESEQLEDISGTGKLTSEEVGGFEVLRDATGNIISTRTLRGDSLKVADDKDLNKPFSPNELRMIRDDYGLSTEDLPVGATMRDVQILQAEKFIEDNADKDPNLL